MEDVEMFGSAAVGIALEEQVIGSSAKYLGS
jgi:hypothetical protein